jgi:fructokinase
MLIRSEDVAESAFADAAIFHFGSVLQAYPPACVETARLVERAKNKGLWIHYDPNLRLSLWPSAESAFGVIRQTLGAADMAKMSSEELEHLTGDADEHRAAAVLRQEMGLRLLVISQGCRGCAYFTPAYSGHVTGFRVEAVDTTGAGDGFVGAFLRFIVHAASGIGSLEDILGDRAVLENCLLRANAVGALVSIRRGAMTSLPNAAQLQDFLASRTQGPGSGDGFG